MTSVEIVHLVTLATRAAMSIGVDLQKFNSMMAESGGQLTDEQRDEIIATARERVDRL